MRRSAAVLALALAAAAPPLAAQSLTNLLDSGIRAYQNLDFHLAERVLARTAHEAAAADSTALAQQALMYLGASEIFLGNLDSAFATFRRMVLDDPRFEADELVFPPQVTSVFDSARNTTPAVSLGVPADTVLTGASPALPIRVYPSTLHRIVLTVSDASGAHPVVLLSGLVADSAVEHWTVPPPARGGTRFRIVAESMDLNGEVLRSVTVPVRVAPNTPDTLALPAPPADSLFLPEHAHDNLGVTSLAAGIGVGAALAVLAPAVAPGGHLTPARFAVAGTVGLAGIIGFFSHKPGRTLDANVAANRAIRQAWMAERDSVAALNLGRRRDAGVVVRAGTAERHEGVAQ